MLKVENLKVHYGVIEAIKDVSFFINEGEIVSLIGANGAGKTTILNTISGFKKQTSGSITYKDKPIQDLNTKTIVSQGISQVPEGRHVFSGMTVMENLDMGAFLRKDRQQIKQDIERVFKSFPILKERRNQDAATLTGGEQRLLERVRY